MYVWYIVDVQHTPLRNDHTPDGCRRLVRSAPVEMTNNCAGFRKMAHNNGRDANARYSSSRSYSETNASELAQQTYGVDPHLRGVESPAGRRPRFSHHLSLCEDRATEEMSTKSGEYINLGGSLQEESFTDDVTSPRCQGLPAAAHAYASSSDSNTSMYDVTGLGPGSRFPWQRDVGVQCSLLKPPHEPRSHSPGGADVAAVRRLKLGVSIDSATPRSTSPRAQYIPPVRSLSDSRNPLGAAPSHLSGINGRLGARCNSDMHLQKKKPPYRKKRVENFCELSSSLPTRHLNTRARLVA